MSDVWKWEHQHAAPVLISPRGSVRRVQRYVKPTRAGDDPWVQETSDAAMFVEALNIFEETRALNRAENSEPSGRPFHLWESEELNINMADVLSWGWRLQNRGPKSLKTRTGIWLDMKTAEEYIVGMDETEAFIKHWRQYQQWRHINGK